MDSVQSAQLDAYHKVHAQVGGANRLIAGATLTQLITLWISCIIYLMIALESITEIKSIYIYIDQNTKIKIMM